MEDQSNYKLSRRSVLKALATVPFIGVIGWGAHAKAEKVLEKKKDLSDLYNQLGFDFTTPLSNGPIRTNNNTLRIGLFGYGIRGKQLMQALGFMHPSLLSDLKEAGQKNKDDTRYADFMNQDDLNIEVVAVCDLYDEYAQMAVEAASNKKRLTTEEFKGTPLTAKRYLTYQELLEDSSVEAVIIATSDNWHAPIATAAAKAHKHVYQEKPFSLQLPDLYMLDQAVRESGVVYQLGHQGRQTESYIKAKEMIDKGLIGHVNRIETTTNRNDSNGAWVYKIPEGAGPNNIDWKQWQANTKKEDFSLEHFFRWRCWWEYGTGLSGDLFTHEYDCVNQLLGVGIPERCVASGGIYKYKDGRTVPDVLTITSEYPDKNLSFVYNATLGNGYTRDKLFMGTEGAMELSGQVKVYPDYASERYKKELDNGTFDYQTPMFVYTSGGGQSNSIDAVTSATAKYFASRGLLYTYRDGKKVDTTFLHLKEWIDCICSNQRIKPSCGIDEAYDEGVTALMGNMSYLEGRTMYWDKDKKEIIKG